MPEPIKTLIYPDNDDPEITPYSESERVRIIETVETMDIYGRMGLRLTSWDSFILPIDYWSQRVH